MINMRDAMREIVKLRKDDIVVSTETSIGAWADVTDDVTFDLPIPAMSKGSSMALGVALAQPDRRVILWDGDGSLLMNLGSLVTVGGMAPSNLYHIVLDNGIYAMTGGQPVPNADCSIIGAWQSLRDTQKPICSIIWRTGLRVSAKCSIRRGLF